MKSAFATLTVIVALTWVPAMARAAGPDIVLADFEGRDYGNWKTSGEAFGAGPAQGTLPHQMTVSGYRGHGLVNSFYGGDKSTGTLTSPDFKIERIAGLLVNQAAYDALLAGTDPRRVAQDWEDGLEKFQKLREKYLIYK